MRAVEPPPNDIHVRRGEAVPDQLCVLVAAHHPVQDLVGLFVGDAQISLIGLPVNEIGGGRFADDDGWNAEVPSE